MPTSPSFPERGLFAELKSCCLAISKHLEAGGILPEDQGSCRHLLCPLFYPIPSPTSVPLKNAAHASGAIAFVAAPEGQAPDCHSRLSEAHIHKSHRTAANEETVFNRLRSTICNLTLGPSAEGAGKNPTLQFLPGDT